MRRQPDRGSYDAGLIRRIIDAALMGHVGFVADGLPYVIPMAVARSGDELLLHGSSASRLMRTLADGADVSVCVTQLDGLVVARSVFDSSMNYRSVVVYGRTRAIMQRDEKLQALRVLVDRLLPGRWEEARPPTDAELKASMILALPLNEASAKVRSGPPKDDENDLHLPVWAGTIPLTTVALAPEPDPLLNDDIDIPESVHRFRAERVVPAERERSSDALLSRPPVTKTDVGRQLRDLGVVSGDVLMVHCSLSSLGYVVGGADAVVSALLEVLGSSGTLVAMTGWEHDPSGLDGWPRVTRDAYRRDPPMFEPDVSEGAREYGRLPERIRTWPGAMHSSHPEARFSAVGRRARWITEGHPWHHPYGPGSPLAKLVEADGHVLMLGAPLETITLLHHAEELADVAEKIQVAYHVPIRNNGALEWHEIRDIDTSNGAFPYARVVGDRDAFEVIGQEVLAAGIGVRDMIGQAVSHLFPARDLVGFAKRWMERHFAPRRHDDSRAFSS